MPRFYDIVKPSSNKAAAPGQEKKGRIKPPVSPPQPPKNEDKKDENGGK